MITKINKEFDKQLAEIFKREGYKVYTANDNILERRIDIYIDTTDERSSSDNFDVRSGIKEQVIKELYDANVIQPMAMLEKFLPLLEACASKDTCSNENDYISKRLCFLTSAEASINETRETDGYGYKMAKAALHNFLQITRNALASKGYTIRVFDPCCFGSGNSAATPGTSDALNPITAELPPELAAEAAFSYFTRRRGVERGDPLRDDEGNLVFRDAYGRQHSW